MVSRLVLILGMEFLSQLSTATCGIDTYHYPQTTHS